MMRHCPLYKHLHEGKNTGVINNPFNEFIKLSSKRDNLGRTLRIQPHNKIFERNCASLTFNYLRHFFLKKLLIMSVMNQSDFEIIKKEFECIIFINPYVSFQKINEAELPINRQLCNNLLSNSISAISSCQ